MDASYEVGGVWNGSGGTGTSSWEHMQEKRVRDLKAAAAEANQRMEASITADIMSGKIKPKVKRNCQPKSAKQIDEDNYNDEVCSRQSLLHLLVLLAASSFWPPASFCLIHVLL
ncbi:hypothetical protein B0H14DRAFT_2589176 [Mycena olivaceomarginata]|nr:hypothetical protein B0H14DRAFT_2589176 [Mycena olivaceomarginata]